MAPKDAAGTSCLRHSLQSARRLADAHPRHSNVLVVVSDFELLDGDVNSVLMELSAFPGVVHAVVLRAAPPRQLVDDESVVVTRIDYTDPPGSLGSSRVRGTHDPPPRHEAGGGHDAAGAEGGA